MECYPITEALDTNLLFIVVNNNKFSSSIGEVIHLNIGNT